MAFWQSHPSYEVVHDEMATPYDGKRKIQKAPDNPCGILFSGIILSSWADVRTGGGVDFYYEAELGNDVLDLKQGSRILRATFDFLANTVTFLLQHKTITFDQGRSFYIEETEATYNLYGEQRTKIKQVTTLRFETLHKTQNENTH